MKDHVTLNLVIKKRRKGGMAAPTSASNDATRVAHVEKQDLNHLKAPLH